MCAFPGVVDSVGFGVTPDADVFGRLDPGLPDVQRTLNWVHLASRYPVRVRVANPSPDLFRVGESAVGHHSRTVNMATLLRKASPALPRSTETWFREFLREELAPYPGRAATGCSHGHRRDYRDDRLHDFSYSVRARCR